MLVRRDRGSLWPEPFDRAFDWTTSPFETFRQLLDNEAVKVEEFTEEGQLVVRVELPGVDPERDVDISIIDGNLQIRAERRQEEKVEHRNYRRNEIRYGSFSRVLPLPPKTKEDDIKASYRDGILEVRAPIDNSTPKPSKIPISRS
ncbi:MAG: Hsp20/alpha crystallin family protein [Acidimicrobiaceae bacterium]|nr:Hsp20/alpha crystallin family protein [Acidimicrobiaceae bacterium]